jgi:integrase
LFAQWLTQQQRGIANAPVFPSLHGKTRGGRGGLCLTFRELMKKAGIVAEMAHTGKGKGRNKSKKSFHSLRHFISSQMAQFGIRSEIARAITGHADERTHGDYVTPNVSSMRDAVNRIQFSA